MDANGTSTPSTFRHLRPRYCGRCALVGDTLETSLPCCKPESEPGRRAETPTPAGHRRQQARRSVPRSVAPWPPTLSNGARERRPELPHAANTRVVVSWRCGSVGAEGRSRKVSCAPPLCSGAHLLEQQRCRLAACLDHKHAWGTASRGPCTLPHARKVAAPAQTVGGPARRQHCPLVRRPALRPLMTAPRRVPGSGPPVS